MAAERAQRIGRRIKELRLQRGMTQAQLADALDEPSVTSTYVSRWERGEHEARGDRLDLIAKALGTTAEDLMAGPSADRTHVHLQAGDTPDPFANGRPAEDLSLSEVTDAIATLTRTVLDLQGEVRALASEVRQQPGEEPGSRR